MEDEERGEIDNVFDQLSQSQSSASQKVAPAAPIPIPQSHVGNRRNRREVAAKDVQKNLVVEPGFGNQPVNIQKNKRILLEGLRHILAAKKAPSKKNAFDETPLDNIDQVTDYLALSETGELIKYSSLVYGLRVDATYNDAMSTNCQLQPSRMKSQDMGKKTKAEQKLQQSTATQSLNLQKLQCEMEQDQPEDAQTESGTPDPDENEEGEGEEERHNTSEEMIKYVSLTPEQREKLKDSRPVETIRIKYSNTVIKDLIAAEIGRRQRNMDRKCNVNPMLMDDERKFRMAPSALLTNEYYQIATARYKDLNASGMLTYNAKVTHNGRMTLMHKRMDTWKDVDVHDYTAPPTEFRRALSGLVDNSLREQPMRMPNYLFDYKDIPAEKKVLTTGLELADIEKKTREKILHRDDEYDFLENDENVEEDEEEATPPPIKKAGEGGETAAAAGEVEAGGETGEGGEGGEGEGESQTGTSSSLNPSTPAAETENSEAAGSERMMTPKGSREKDDDKEDPDGVNQADKDDMAVMSAAPRKKKLRKAAALSSVMSENEIKMGPVLSTDDLAAQFQQILFDKVSMGSKVEWRHGANAEELQTDSKTINEESVYVEKCSMDMDLMHLDKLWTSKYYSKVITPEEVKEIKANMKRVMDNSSYEKKVLYFKAGEYEFMGEDDKWTNSSIPPDELAGVATEEEPLVRQLEDQNELEKHKKALEAEEDSDVDHGSFDVDVDDERIVIAPEGINYDDAMNDDHDMAGFMSDEEPPTSSTVDKRSDFTAGDDQRVGEMGDVHGMLDPTFVSDVQPSAAVRGTGKADDSHWKGGNPENAQVKKEKKRKPKEEQELKTRSYFDCDDNMLDKKKCTNRFKQAAKNFELMKETDQLLMPVQVNVVPQLDYDTSLFYHSYFLPKELHSKYVYRDSNIVNPNDETDDVIHVEGPGRLEHYSNMLDSSMREEKEEGADSVYTSFLRTFRNYPEVSTQKEMDLEERVRTGEMAADEAAAELNNSDNADMNGGGGMDFPDDDDFGGGGGMDDDDLFSGGGGGGGDEEGGGLPELPSEATTATTTFVPKGERREASQARSLALASTHGYGMRVANSDEGDDEGDAIATVGDREYHLRLIKLDTVAMKTALSDVLTNPLMVAEKLDETLGHFHRNLPSQRGERKKEKPPMQAINEDEELEVQQRSAFLNDSQASSTMGDTREVDIEATMMEVPDAMNVTRALFAPPKEKAKPTKTMTFGEAANASQNLSNSQEHIELKGHHTLKSTFTCLPARMPLRATSDVTVASTIAMILHLANENNLILNQSGQNEGLDDDANTTTTHGNWMNDFEVHCDDDDADGTTMQRVSQRISNAVEVLQQLSADEDASDAEKRQRQTEKMLAELAAKQREEAEEERKKKANGVAKRDMPGTSRAAAEAASDDSDCVIDVVGDDEPAFKKPRTPHKVEPAVKRTTPRNSGDFEAGEGPSTKRARTRRPSDGANTTIDMEETIVID